MLSEALARLRQYNLNPFKIDTNPFGLTGTGGTDTNLEPMLADVATVGTELQTALGTTAAGLSAVLMAWDVGTAVGDPGAGKMRASSPNPATGSYSLVLSTTDADGVSIAAVLTELGASSSMTKARARVVKVGDRSTYVDLLVTGVAVAAGYQVVAVTCIGGPGGFATGDAVAMGWVRTGDKGDTGAAGAQGAGPVYYSTPTAGTANAQTLSGPLASLAGNPSIEWIAGATNGSMSRTNACLQSADFSTTWATFGGAAVTANTATAPDGTTNADMISGGTGAGVNQSISVTADTTTRVYSTFLKAGTSSACRIQLNHGSAQCGLNVNLSAGTISTWFGSPVASSIDPIPGGFYRVSVAIANNSGTTIVPHVFPVQGSGSGTVYAWGAQVETGSVPTAYIPTTIGSVTVTDGYMTLAVGSTQARPLLDYAGKAPAAGAVTYGRKYVVTYDGAYWRLAGGGAGASSVNLAATHAALFSI
ncbi:hypothetical protein AL072_29830 [Azospirillum thiophilum]|uniref:Uncharacterized protein n=2 Tax=Azospirillum thiophilum TaxID=528244 RepID=A0AAC8ZWK2_9PROT|nr:hypothetical protein AL072_29830 [Azospirillum thiophilum]